MTTITFTEKLGSRTMSVTIAENTANLVVTEVDRLNRFGLIPKGFYTIPKLEEES